MIPNVASDESWTRISLHYAQKREQVVEATEALIWRGLTYFTCQMVRDECEAIAAQSGLEWYDVPRTNLVERTLAEMVEGGFLRVHVAGRPGRARVYTHAGREA